MPSSSANMNVTFIVTVDKIGGMVNRFHIKALYLCLLFNFFSFPVTAATCGKFLWMVHVGGSTEKGPSCKHINENDYYTIWRIPCRSERLAHLAQLMSDVQNVLLQVRLRVIDGRWQASMEVVSCRIRPRSQR